MHTLHGFIQGIKIHKYENENQSSDKNIIYFCAQIKMEMDLSKILSISGKPGLYKMLTQTKNGLVVEGLADSKKFTAFSHERISTLEEISIYTTDEDRPLKEILKAIYDLQEGNAAVSHKSSNDELKAFFVKAVPDYDEENVYISDIKKVINWYNILHEHNQLEFTEEEVEEETKEGDKKEDIPEVENKEEKNTEENKK